MNPAEQPTYRYPGMRAFERNETQLFYGREQECFELYNQVKVQQLTVLFAKSGIGKSSLINAGLLPLLERDFFFPVKIRLQDTTINPIDTVRNVLQPYLDTALLKRHDQGVTGLWEYVRACSFQNQEGTPLTPVFIFDQFEEFFNHAPEDRRNFLDNLANLINKRLPGPLQQSLRQIPRDQRDEDVLTWHSPIPCRVVLAIRSDRISQLDSLKERIPTILHHRYQLRPLMTGNARQAIIQPALLEDERFSSPPFQYSEDALAVMLDSLANKEEEIESFQLQILCQHIEKTVGSDHDRLIDPGDFGGADGLQHILNTYYERQISTLAPTDQVIARRFIEEGLIIDGQRVGISAGEEERRFNVSPALLAQLLDSRLVRTETIHLGQIYELSHDTLVEPITRSYYARREQEEKEAARRELAEEREQVALANRKKQRAYLYAAMAAALAILAFLAGAWALRSKRMAEANAQEARIATLANKAWDVFKDDNTLALRLAQAAYQLDTTNEQARTTLYNIINNRNCTFYKAVCGQREENANTISDVAFSYDNRWLATADWDANIRIWDTTGTLASTFYSLNFGSDTTGHSATILALAFSPTAPFLVSAGEDRRIKLWDVVENKHIRDFPDLHRSQVNDLAFSADGQRFLSGSRDSTARLWAIDGSPVMSLSGHEGGVNAVAIAPDGTHYLTGDEKGIIYLWSPSGNLMRKLPINAERISALQFAPDGRSILIGTSSNTASLLKLNGEILATFGGHTAGIADVGFSPDGRMVLTASADGKAKLWTLQGEEILSFSGHSEQLTSAAFSPNGRYVATGSYDQLAKIWDVNFNLSYRRGLWHTDAINTITISPSGRRIATGSADQSIKLWGPDGNYIRDLRGHTAPVLALAFSPSDSLLASGGFDRTIRLWNTNGQCLTTMEGHSDAVNKLDFSPDGSRIASCGGGRDGSIRIWDLEGREIASWIAHSGNSVYSVEYSDDGQTLLSCGYGGMAIRWSLDGIPLDTFDNAGTPLYAARGRDDHSGIITAGYEFPVRRWNEAGEVVQTYYGHHEEVYSLCWSPDGRQFASASWDKSVIIWGTAAGFQHRLPHPDAVFDVVFSPDGEQVLSAGRDRVGRIWSVEDGRLLYAIGEYNDAGKMTGSPAVASLHAIPFSLASYGISLDYAPLLFANDQDGLIRQAQELAFQALDQSADFAKSYELFQQSIRLLEDHRSHPEARRILSFTYEKQTDHLLKYQEFDLALTSARDGLEIAPDHEYLSIFRILCLIYTGQVEEAVSRYGEVKDKLITQISFYPNFREAVSGELWWFDTQFGISSEDVAVFTERISEE